MNREKRRHPEKKVHEQETVRKQGQQDEEAARAKSHRHKKVTADKWNQ